MQRLATLAVRGLRLAGRAALDALLPECCAFCGAVGEGLVCADCDEALPRIRRACDRCAAGLPPTVAAGVACAACQRRPLPQYRTRAPFAYAFPVDAALKALKFRARLPYAPAFAALLAPELAAFPAADALAPVPLHRFRHWRRGFNQAQELARELARRSGLPLVSATRRLRPTRPQSGLSARERRHNVAGAFGIQGTLGCRRPLIVDDVVTTGETCAQLAQVLLRAGAREVGVLAVARALPADARQWPRKV